MGCRMENKVITDMKQIQSASSCIDIYANILKDKLIYMGKLQDETDLLVEFQSDYDCIELLLSHISDKSDEIAEYIHNSRNP